MIKSENYICAPHRVLSGFLRLCWGNTKRTCISWRRYCTLSRAHRYSAPSCMRQLFVCWMASPIPSVLCILIINNIATQKKFHVAEIRSTQFHIYGVTETESDLLIAPSVYNCLQTLKKVAKIPIEYLDNFTFLSSPLLKTTPFGG